MQHHDVMDGWDVSRPTERWRWKAVRREPLDARQRAYGCEVAVYADSYPQLELLVSAERIKASIVDAAWRLYTRMAEADRRLTEDVDGGAGIDGAAPPST